MGIFLQKFTDMGRLLVLLTRYPNLQGGSHLAVALMQEFFEELMGQDAPAAAFMKKITSKCWAYSKESMKNKRDVYFGPGFVSYDAYAMAACVDSSVVTQSICCPVRVELQGSVSRGMMALDRTNELKKSHSVHILTKCDVEKFARLLLASVQQPQKN